MDKEKTVMVVISKNIMRRNILETEFWKEFTEKFKDGRIVLVGEHGEKIPYTEKFSGPNIVVDELGQIQYSFWQKIVLFLVRAGTNTNGVRLYRWRNHTVGTASLSVTLLKAFLANTFARFSFYHSFLRSLYARIEIPWIEQLLNEYEPDILFVPAIVDLNYDALVGAAAKRRGIRVVGMVRSWDNMAIHGLLPFVPDVFIFQNQYLKECATKLQSMNIDAIKTSVIGLPHYDYYRFPEAFIQPRQEFLTSNGLDPNKKLILLGGFDFYWSEDVLPGHLDAAISNGKIIKPVQVVFRPHPSTPFQMEDYNIDTLKHTTLNAPFLDKKTAFNDKDFFINLVYHCDVLINVASTLAIDGSVFDRPVICINYDDPSKKLPKWKQAGRLFDSFDHYEALMETGCAKVSLSFDDMINDINAYLENPSLDAEKRKKAVEKFVAPYEGDSGLRLVNQLLAEIDGV